MMPILTSTPSLLVTCLIEQKHSITEGQIEEEGPAEGEGPVQEEGPATEGPTEEVTQAPAPEAEGQVVERQRFERQQRRRPRFGKRLRPPSNRPGNPTPTSSPEALELLKSSNIPDEIWDLRT